MDSLIICLVFNIVGIGISYLLNFIGPKEKISGKTGTLIFFGFLGGMLLTYTLWLFLPYSLNIACYIIFVIAAIGLALSIKNGEIESVLKSDYWIVLLLLLPFIILVQYNPGSWDEFSHWLLLPKAFYYQLTLTPTPIECSTSDYTPLWALQAVFFQFFLFHQILMNQLFLLLGLAFFYPFYFLLKK
ncbi:hypothetical protein [Candidatus Paracaedibacter symbiosus]|uniref:hypothetical protein n=1 Tax=Candidatus Paracaedibacter symbiosus TaxID=244582 RepID=UPI0005097D85|nr:hypothetical protein [Candidatus Paracaedibacter symbiosus]